MRVATRGDARRVAAGSMRFVFRVLYFTGAEVGWSGRTRVLALMLSLRCAIYE